MTTETLLRWVEEFSNWGRWDNELGAANFITDKKRTYVAKMVTKGIMVSMAHPLMTIPFDPAQLLPADIGQSADRDAEYCADADDSARPGQRQPVFPLDEPVEFYQRPL